MAEFPALPLWTDAYIADTMHLTNEEHGVYLRLLMFAWRTPECCLPVCDKRLAIMVGVSDKRWQSIKGVILSFWTEKDGHYYQKRLTAGREKVLKTRNQKSNAGIASAAAKQLKNNKTGRTGVATHAQQDGNGADNGASINQNHNQNHKEKESVKNYGNYFPPARARADTHPIQNLKQIKFQKHDSAENDYAKWCALYDPEKVDDAIAKTAKEAGSLDDLRERLSGLGQKSGQKLSQTKHDPDRLLADRMNSFTGRQMTRQSASNAKRLFDAGLINKDVAQRHGYQPQEGTR